MSEEKSIVDKLFDIADQALTPLERALAPNTPAKDRPIDVAWNESFEEPWWAHAKRATGAGAWHQFDQGSLKAACGEEYESHEVTNRQVLKHGTFIPTCTSCIIAVMK